MEPFKEYKFEIILDIHENILNLLSIIISTLNNKENELLLHKNKQSIGLNIDNFITTFNYNIIVMREKIIMFITYIEFFHKLHTKYLKRFANKIQLMYSHINNDIQFDERVDIKKGLDDSDSSNYDNDKNINRVKIENREKTEVDNDSNASNSDISSNSNQFDILDIQPISQYRDNISERTRSDSVLSNVTGNVTPRFKLKNVVKTMNNLKVLSNTKEEPKNIEEKLSHDDLNDMFSTIDISCDSIINNEKETEENIQEKNAEETHAEETHAEETHAEETHAAETNVEETNAVETNVVETNAIETIENICL